LGKHTRMTPSQTSKPRHNVTLQDIADRCQVSRATVSRALRNDLRNISQAVIDQITAVANEMGYDPSLHHSARRLALSWRGRPVLNRIVALFIPPVFIDDLYYSQQFKGVLDVLSAEGFGMLTMYEHPSTLDTLLPIFSRGDVDGVISISIYGRFTDLQQQLRNDINFGQRPMIILMLPPDDSFSVMPDDFLGGQIAAGHMLDLGHQHILYFNFTGYAYAHHQRKEGFKAACRDRNVDFDNVFSSILWDFDKIEWSTDNLTRTLSANKNLTAIIAPNDNSANYIYNALKSANISVPEDVSLIGYDDVVAVKTLTNDNILTTIHVPLIDIGRAAAKLMIKQLTNQEKEDSDTIVLPVELIIRSSTAPPSTR
jgi:LacI family transcriptional regulator